jgi:hypothetical protein
MQTLFDTVDTKSYVVPGRSVLFARCALASHLLLIWKGEQ